MINKKNLWFLTLFSLVLVLSIYYVTMPTEVFDASLKDKQSTEESKEEVSVNDVTAVETLKVEDDASVQEKINSLKEKLTNKDVTTDEKNSVFEELKTINKNSSKEETIESKVKELCNCDNFVKIEGDNVRVVLDSKESSTTLANNIMRLVQKEFDEKKFISVKFN